MSSIEKRPVPPAPELDPATFPSPDPQVAGRNHPGFDPRTGKRAPEQPQQEPLSVDVSDDMDKVVTPQTATPR
ncbi:MAG TPA: hypothetical protein VGD08_14355 [Stellaceae bacterium]|jgi:hypothetical protein